MHEAIPPLFPPQNSQTLLDAMQMVFFGARLNPSEEAKVRAALDRYMHEEKPTIEHVLSRRVQILMLTFLLDGKELTEQSRDEICTQAIEHSAIDTSDFIPEDLYDAYDHSLNVFLARKYIRPNEPPRRTDQDEADGEGLAQ